MVVFNFVSHVGIFQQSVFSVHIFKTESQASCLVKFNNILKKIDFTFVETENRFNSSWNITDLAYKVYYNNLVRINEYFSQILTV